LGIGDWGAFVLGSFWVPFDKPTGLPAGFPLPTPLLGLPPLRPLAFAAAMRGAASAISSETRPFSHSFSWREKNSERTASTARFSLGFVARAMLYRCA